LGTPVAGLKRAGPVRRPAAPGPRAGTGGGYGTAGAGDGRRYGAAAWPNGRSWKGQGGVATGRGVRPRRSVRVSPHASPPPRPRGPDRPAVRPGACHV